MYRNTELLNRYNKKVEEVVKPVEEKKYDDMDIVTAFGIGSGLVALFMMLLVYLLV